MTRTVKGVVMNVVMVDKGSPKIVERTFTTTKREEINRLCKKIGMLPVWETAMLIESVFYMDDTFFIENAEIMSTETRPYTDDKGNEN